MPTGSSTPRDPLGKAIVLVFLTIWTLGAGSIAAGMLGGSFMAHQAGMPGPVTAAPGLMAIVPVGFVIIGILLFIKVAITPTGSSNTSREVYREVQEAPVEAPRPAVPQSCPGCGSRKNIPGATVCAYCGGNLAPSGA